ncbi:MAG: hypothetical protein ACKPKO_43025, partial [Candidatus Fonsibacter sp.]
MNICYREDGSHARNPFDGHIRRIVHDLQIEPGQTVVFGLCNQHQYPTISDETLDHLKAIIDLNDRATYVVMESKVLHVRLTIIHLRNTASSVEMSGSGKRGKVIYVCVR